MIDSADRDLSTLDAAITSRIAKTREEILESTDAMHTIDGRTRAVAVAVRNQQTQIETIDTELERVTPTGLHTPQTGRFTYNERETPEKRR